jgi:hypothetical protein
MSQHQAGFLGSLSNFVLEVLPWALSSLIGLYLLWGFWLGATPARAAFAPAASPAAFVAHVPTPERAM